jgi:tetratricopeptide (TPR) repeat protein
MKKVTMLLGFVAMAIFGQAQTLDEVKTMMYYEKVASAKAGLDKLIAATPNDASVVYQLGQWHLFKGDFKAATELLNKAMPTSSNANLLKAGLAHAASVGQNNILAKQLATEVLASTKATDMPVMLALGKAMGELRGKQDENANVNGFFGFSFLDKITNAYTAKKNDPAFLVALGDCLVRTQQGGKAVNAYEKAVGFVPNYAEAYYRSGLMFNAVKNYVQRDNYFAKALQADPNYGPVYKFKFFEGKDANNYTAARDNYAKYASLTETSPQIESYTCDLTFLSKDYLGCIDCVDKLMAKLGDAAPARLHAVKAYAYDQLGDSLKAASSMDAYFAKEKEIDVDVRNVAKKAAILAKIPERQNEAFVAFDKAIEMDTTAEGKLNTTRTAAALAAKYKNMPMALKYYEQIYNMRGEAANNIDVFNVANIYYGQKNFAKADEWYGVYTKKFPTDMYGYKQRAFINKSMDSTLKGTAKPHVDALLALALLDTAKNKVDIISSYTYFANVAIKATKYKEAAEWYEKMLVLSPDDEGIKKNIGILKGGASKPAPPAPKTTTPTPTTGGIKTAPKPPVKVDPKVAPKAAAKPATTKPKA